MGGFSVHLACDTQDDGSKRTPFILVPFLPGIAGVNLNLDLFFNHFKMELIHFRSHEWEIHKKVFTTISGS